MGVLLNNFTKKYHEKLWGFTLENWESPAVLELYLKELTHENVDLEKKQELDEQIFDVRTLPQCDENVVAAWLGSVENFRSHLKGNTEWLNRIFHNKNYAKNIKNLIYAHQQTGNNEYLDMIVSVIKTKSVTEKEADLIFNLEEKGEFLNNCIMAWSEDKNYLLRKINFIWPEMTVEVARKLVQYGEAKKLISLRSKLESTDTGIVYLALLKAKKLPVNMLEDCLLAFDFVEEQRNNLFNNLPEKSKNTVNKKLFQQNIVQKQQYIFDNMKDGNPIYVGLAYPVILDLMEKAHWNKEIDKILFFVERIFKGQVYVDSIDKNNVETYIVEQLKMLETYHLKRYFGMYNTWTTFTLLAIETELVNRSVGGDEFAWQQLQKTAGRGIARYGEVICQHLPVAQWSKVLGMETHYSEKIVDLYQTYPQEYCDMFIQLLINWSGTWDQLHKTMNIVTE